MQSSSTVLWTTQPSSKRRPPKQTLSSVSTSMVRAAIALPPADIHLRYCSVCRRCPLC